jgi:hypothetical protein
MFAGALLLVSLTLLGQRNKGAEQISSQQSIEHIELQAELCPNQAAEAFLSLIRYESHSQCEFRSGDQLHLEYQKCTLHQIRIKDQMQIHLKLKPLIGFKSCYFLLHGARYEDPPLC